MLLWRSEQPLSGEGTPPWKLGNGYEPVSRLKKLLSDLRYPAPAHTAQLC